VITNSGPDLRTAEFAVKYATGEVVPADNAVDKGLDVTAEEFREELQKKFDRAIKALTSP
jgi:hypothetical protein